MDSEQDTLAIGEHVAEWKPQAGVLPADRAARAHCRAICGEYRKISRATSRRARRSGAGQPCGRQASVPMCSAPPNMQISRAMTLTASRGLS